tara:strand:+ start:272 stop:793 length:522 start_codon:yes stop_codon:yes gene_type:complete
MINRVIIKVFLTIAIMLPQCVAHDSFDDSGDYDYSIVLDDLDSTYNRYRLWYNEDGSYLLLVSEAFENQQPVALYLEGKITLDIQTLNAARQGVLATSGSSCVQVFLYNDHVSNHEESMIVCDEARNEENYTTVLEYFDMAFTQGTSREGSPEKDNADRQWSLPSSKLTFTSD